MKHLIKTSIFTLIILFTFSSCNNSEKQVNDNINMYSKVWDEIINNGNLDLINDTNFQNDITLVSYPENVVGIENFKGYYSNFTTGFSNVEFTIENIFGQKENLVKHWNFKGTHSGEFFGIPATGKSIDISGVTLVKMKDGKIAQEQDFMDNMDFMQQLGIVSSPDNVTVVDNMYKAFGEGDIPSVLASLDEKVVWNEAEGNPYAYGNPYIGPEAVSNGIFSRIGEEHVSFGLFDIKLHNMSNNQVLATLRYKGKYKNGNAIDVQAAHLWTINNGKATSFQQFADTKQISEARRK